MTTEQTRTRYRILHGVEPQYLRNDGMWDHFLNSWPGYLSDEAESAAAELVRRANLTDKLQAERDALVEALRAFQDGFVYIDGHDADNRIRHRATPIFRDALNNTRALLESLEATV